ncbi:MAG TPA: PhoU domain-containing protein [Egibacteraceae bacterium]|nr:PhoU domain-containing protein [Egibacteraceae bacterium]
MFKWLRAGGTGLDEVEETFADMLSDDRHVFDLAMSARVGGAEPATVAEALNRTEERTDEAERRIRRLVLVHASVHGASDIPACLMYMSIAKDAERIADLSKNLFGIADTVGVAPDGEARDDLVRLRDKISPMISEAARLFVDDDRAAAEAFIETARDLQEHCHRQIDTLLRDQDEVPQAAATVLTYRHLSRIVANLLNIVSAVVMPLDRLDYPGEDEPSED